MNNMSLSGGPARYASERSVDVRMNFDAANYQRSVNSKMKKTESIGWEF